MDFGKPQGPSLNEYYSAVQLRTDRWTTLRYKSEALVRNVDRDEMSQKLIQEISDLLTSLQPIELYWAFPGHLDFNRLRDLLMTQRFDELARTTAHIVQSLLSGNYKHKPHYYAIHQSQEDNDKQGSEKRREHKVRPYFEVLVVDDFSENQEERWREMLFNLRRTNDNFVYEPVFVSSVMDALIAIMFNYNIQTVVVGSGPKLKSNQNLEILHRYLARIGDDIIDDIPLGEYGTELCRLVGRVRPEIDVFLFTDQSVEEIACKDLGNCRRVFYNQEGLFELHINILRSLNHRYETPFFNALQDYAKKPTGVFHALPISRGKSITRSNWIKDMGDFYGMNIFLAETSATSGGLDSLLEPHGPIKKAQTYAARAFGAKHTFFSTNGTSTCNKVVVQALVQPGDIVLVDRDCHKSHHYGMVLVGAQVIYLDSYPINQYSMYGAVPLKEIKSKLLELKRVGKLNRVRMVLLTNCTFDGIVYNVERVMEECLAIKPDLVFLWDEAWFAFARFGPSYRQRTAMHNAQLLRERYRTPEYRAAYEKHKKEIAGADDETLINTRLMPDPAKARIRVYACQSTHKTLTALRQGSMIHVHDQDFKGEVEQAFHEAYMTHTSTSPNYQIIASLDVGRRQVELEGFELFQRQVEAAMSLRKAISTHPLLNKYFKILTVMDMIPSEYRTSGIESYWDPEHGWTDMWQAWAEDEFALDATRITLAIGGAGYDGDTFKNEILMDKYGIQINKTSRNTVLFMTNIGTTRSSIAYLIEVLVSIAQDLDSTLDDAGRMEKIAFDNRVAALTRDLPPLPDFSRFHEAFCQNDQTGTMEGDIRSAYFLAHNESKCEYFALRDTSIEEEMKKGRQIVSSSFIIPYPPGFPILVPGQVISMEILTFMRALDVKEIHGYRADLGLRVFTEKALNELLMKMNGAHLSPPVQMIALPSAEISSKETDQDKPISIEVTGSEVENNV